MDAEAVQTKNEQKRTDFIQEVTLYSWLYDIISKRNRELFRIAAYMRKNSGKGEFVDVYNDCCEHFLEEGNEAMEGLLNIKDELKSGDAVRKREFCHGNYQHHNIMKCRENWVTTGLEHFYFGVQLEDLYDYLRKVLEKNDYNMDFAKAVLCGYGSEHELTLRDYQCLYLLLIYPVKFWKISNRYFNSRKTWIPPKMVEKLQNVVKQDEEKRNFLVKFKEDYVD